MKTRKPSTKRRSRESIDAGELEATEILDGQEGHEEQEASDEKIRRIRGIKAGKKSEKLTRWEQIESLLRMASLIAISISVVLTALQYYENRLDGKKERSMEFMTEWQKSEERDAYARLGRALEVFIQAAGPIPDNIEPAALDAIKNKIGGDLIRSWRRSQTSVYDERSQDIESIFDFYSDIEFCIRANLCDKALLEDYFAAEVESFWLYFRAYAEKQRGEFYPSFGEPVEALIKEFKKPAM